MRLPNDSSAACNGNGQVLARMPPGRKHAMMCSIPSRCATTACGCMRLWGMSVPMLTRPGSRPLHSVSVFPGPQHITREVCQEPRFPKGSARVRGCALACLSHASPLGSVLLPHDAFQEYATHPAVWSAALHSHGAECPCIRSGLAPCLHCACTAHAEVVVDHWTSAGEPSSPRDFLARRVI
jgi:hypothetical protein